MKRRDLDYVVITLLVGSSLYVFLTGLVADTMGLQHFGWHSQVGYLWISLSAIHLMQTWIRVKAFTRHRFRGGSAARSKLPLSSDSLGQSSNLSQATASTRPKEIPSLPEGKALGRRYLLWAVLAIATGIGFDRLVTPSETIELAGTEQDLGVLYHRWSEPGYGEAIDTLLNWGQQPPRYKTYANVPTISLPSADLIQVTPTDTTGGDSDGLIPDFMTVMTQRRSQRAYSNRYVLSLRHLSQLLYLAHGITWEKREFRAVPSSGALYPLEIYPIVHRVEGIEPGIYHHSIQDHLLEQLQLGDFRQPLVKAGLNQDFLGEANVCFVVSGIFQRTRWKYHERTYRYVLMEAGHLGQNLYLSATALGLGVCGIGAFLDTPLNELLNLDGEQEAALYLVTVGGR
ncbi:MAG: SagB/ThcOx family dehydrogenase [Leptolyngbyaceae cyanobacterium]